MSALLPILVDYHNIRNAKYRRDPRLLVARIVSLVEANAKGSFSRLKVRFYGGWYEGNSLTRDAQSLIVSIGNPPTYVVPFRGAKTIAHLELATGIEAFPSATLPNTLRNRVKVVDIHCKGSHEIGCTQVSCPFDAIRRFTQTSQCPTVGCSVTARDVLKRREQKLVDTCLAVDALTHGYNRVSDLVVISSDDDLWPAVLAASKHGTHVHRIRTDLPSSFDAAYHSISSATVQIYDL